MATHEDQCCSGMLQFPQPSKPLYDDFNMYQNQSPQRYYNYDEVSTRTHEEGEQFVSNDDDLMRTFEEFVEELNDKGHELFDKIVSQDSRFRKLKMFLTKLDGPPTSMDRGVNVDHSSSKVEDVRRKLERFKVKTINVAGIVKQEIKK